MQVGIINEPEPRGLNFLDHLNRVDSSLYFSAVGLHISSRMIHNSVTAISVQSLESSCVWVSPAGRIKVVYFPKGKYHIELADTEAELGRAARRSPAVD